LNVAVKVSSRAAAVATHKSKTETPARPVTSTKNSTRPTEKPVKRSEILIITLHLSSTVCVDSKSLEQVHRETDRCLTCFWLIWIQLKVLNS